MNTPFWPWIFNGKTSHVEFSLAFVKAPHGSSVLDFARSQVALGHETFWGWNCSANGLKMVSRNEKEIPSLKLTWHLKMDGWNTSFLLGSSIFRCYVSFRECIIFQCFFLGVECEFCIVYMYDHYVVNEFRCFKASTALHGLHEYKVSYCVKVTMSLHLGFCLITAQQVRIKSSSLPQHSHTQIQISLHVKNPRFVNESSLQPPGLNQTPPKKTTNDLSKNGIQQYQKPNLSRGGAAFGLRCWGDSSFDVKWRGGINGSWMTSGAVS